MGVLSGIDDVTGWTLLQKNTAPIEKSYAAGTSSASDIAYFEKVAPTFKTPADLLANYRALTFVTTAFGIAGDQDQTALLKKLMTQNPASSSSLAQQLANVNYLRFATALSNWSSTSTPFSTKAGVQSVVAAYQQSSFQANVSTDNTALGSALYFQANAKGITTLNQLMSDPTLLSVVTTGLGIPTAFGNLSFQQQVHMLTPLVKLSQFSTTAGINSFINKYLTMDTLNQYNSGATAPSGSGSSSASILNLFPSGGGSSSGTGINITAGMVNFVA